MSANSIGGVQIPPSLVTAPTPRPTGASVCARMCEPGPGSRGIRRQNGPYPSAYGSEGWEFESLRAHTVLRQYPTKTRGFPRVFVFLRSGIPSDSAGFTSDRRLDGFKARAVRIRMIKRIVSGECRLDQRHMCAHTRVHRLGTNLRCLNGARERAHKPSTTSPPVWSRSCTCRAGSSADRTRSHDRSCRTRCAPW